MVCITTCCTTEQISNSDNMVSSLRALFSGTSWDVAHLIENVHIYDCTRMLLWSTAYLCIFVCVLHVCVCPEAFLKEEESDKAALVEEILTCPTSAQGAVDGKCGVERSNGWGRGSEVAGVPEIVEEILGQVPIYHLYSSCRLVCRKWNHIILREKVSTIFSP